MVDPEPEDGAADAEQRADEHFERGVTEQLHELLGLPLGLLEVALDQGFT